MEPLGLGERFNNQGVAVVCVYMYMYMFVAGLPKVLKEKSIHTYRLV